MQTVSSASRTCFRLLSAVEWTATVLMPISRQARRMRSAISPRLAMTTFSSIVALSSALVDYEQHLPVFHGLAVLHADGPDDAGHLRLDLVHHLHRFDDAEDVALLHAVPDLHERRCAGRGGRIESAHHGRGDQVPFLLFLLRRGGRL